MGLVESTQRPPRRIRAWVQHNPPAVDRYGGARMNSKNPFDFHFTDGVYGLPGGRAGGAASPANWNQAALSGYIINISLAVVIRSRCRSGGILQRLPSAHLHWNVLSDPHPAGPSARVHKQCWQSQRGSESLKVVGFFFFFLAGRV